MLHKNVVVDQIKELLQAHIDHNPTAFLRILLCFSHCIIDTLAKLEAIAELGEGWIDQRLRDWQQCLLDQPIDPAL